MNTNGKVIPKRPAVPFQQHPSFELVQLFKARPFQGQTPEKASILFLSSDANYSPEISGHPFFDCIFEYHENSLTFWQRYDCHHPFLLKCYPFLRDRDWVPSHRNFSKLFLEPEHAKYISFIELLDVPTMGNKSQNRKLFFGLTNPKHLRKIDELVRGGGHKLFFVSQGVLEDMKIIKKKYKNQYPDLFDWLNLAQGGLNQQFSLSINGNKIKEIYHFSSSQIHGQIDDIRTDIDEWLT